MAAKDDGIWHTPPGSQSSNLDNIDIEVYTDPAPERGPATYVSTGVGVQTLEIGTQTQPLPPPPPPRGSPSIGTYIFSFLYLIAVIGMLLFIGGLAGLDSNVSNSCVEITTTEGTSCIPTSFGLYYFIWIFQFIQYVAMGIAIKKKKWPEYRFLLNAWLVSCLTVEMWGADLFITIAQLTYGNASSSAGVTVAGLIMVMIANYSFLSFLGPSEHSSVARMIRKKEIKDRKISFYFNPGNWRKRKPKKTGGADTSPEAPRA